MEILINWKIKALCYGLHECIVGTRVYNDKTAESISACQRQWANLNILGFLLKSVLFFTYQQEEMSLYLDGRKYTGEHLLHSHGNIIDISV